MVSGLWFMELFIFCTRNLLLIYFVYLIHPSLLLFSFYSNGTLEDAASEGREAGQFAVNR